MARTQVKLWLALIGSLFFIYLCFSRMPQEENITVLDISDKVHNHATKTAAPIKVTLSPPTQFNSRLSEDYVPDPKDHDHWCSDWYGPKYLEYPASHHAPYCQANASHSSLECFNTHNIDPFCVAKGVLLDLSRINHTDDTKNSIALHCKLRDWNHDNKTEGLAGFKNIEDLPDYFYWTGARRQLQTWDIGTDELNMINGTECTSEKNDNKYTLLVRREANSNIWHKLMELWQSMITIDILHLAIDPETSKPYLSPTTEIDVIFEDQDNGPVDMLWDEWWRGKPIVRKQTIDTPACLSNVILPLPGSSSPFWQSHWETRDCKETFMLDAQLKRFYRQLGMDPPIPRLKENTTVTIVDRKQTRQIYDLERHVATLQKRWPNVHVQMIDFGVLSLREQIAIAHETDVLVGVIGAGLTHILFMPPEGSVAEIMSLAKFDYAGFRNLAKQRGLNYMSVHGKGALEWEQLGNTADRNEIANIAEKKRIALEKEEAERERRRLEQEEKEKKEAQEAQEMVQMMQKTTAEKKERALEESLVDEDIVARHGGEIGIEVDEDVTGAGTEKLGKRWDWQEGEFVYIEDDLFQSLVDAAINAQLNRGLRRFDVPPSRRYE